VAIDLCRAAIALCREEIVAIDLCREAIEAHDLHREVIVVIDLCREAIAVIDVSREGSVPRRRVIARSAPWFAPIARIDLRREGIDLSLESDLHREGTDPHRGETDPHRETIAANDPHREGIDPYRATNAPHLAATALRRGPIALARSAPTTAIAASTIERWIVAIRARRAALARLLVPPYDAAPRAPRDLIAPHRRISLRGRHLRQRVTARREHHPTLESKANRAIHRQR